MKGKFEIGDIVTCIVRGMYNITDVGVLCTVESASEGAMLVSVEHFGELRSFEVDTCNFSLVKRGDDERIVSVSSLDYADSKDLDTIDKLLIEEAIQNESMLR